MILFFIGTQRRPRHQSAISGDRSVRERLYQIEEGRKERELVRNEKLGEIVIVMREVTDELRLMRQALEVISRSHQNN